MGREPRMAIGEAASTSNVYISLPPTLKNLLVWGGSRIQPGRFDELRELHRAFFPVKYSDGFYEKIFDNTYPSRILYERHPSGLGRIVGFASSIIYKEPFKGYLATLGVRPEWRKMGVAKVLISCIEAHLFRNYQIDYVELHVLHSNVAAIRLYESLRYTMTAYLEKHYVFEDPRSDRKRHDAYLYRKYRFDDKRGVRGMLHRSEEIRGLRPTNYSRVNRRRNKKIENEKVVKYGLSSELSSRYDSRRVDWSRSADRSYVSRRSSTNDYIQGTGWVSFQK